MKVQEFLGKPPSQSRFATWVKGSKAGSRLPFFWGFAEASFFVIIPDVVIGLVAMWSITRGLKAAAWASLGAVLGGAIVYLVPNFWQAFFPYLPGIGPEIMNDAAANFARDGWLAVILGPSAGIPYKLFAAEAAIQGRPLLELLFWTPIARAWRFVIVALVAALVGYVIRWVRDRFPVTVGSVYLLFWVGVYVQYAMFLAERYP